jgi:hypothetical protein
MDITGTFVPPLQWYGQASVAAWDAREMYRYMRYGHEGPKSKSRRASP